MRYKLDELTAADLEPFVDTRMAFQTMHEQVHMQLTAVEVSRFQDYSRQENRRPAFSVFFCPEDDRRYPQGSYGLILPGQVEPMMIFMSPVMGKGPKGFLMQAVFN